MRPETARAKRVRDGDSRCIAQQDSSPCTTRREAITSSAASSTGVNGAFTRFEYEGAEAGSAIWYIRCAKFILPVTREMDLGRDSFFAAAITRYV